MQAPPPNYVQYPRGPGGGGGGSFRGPGIYFEFISQSFQMIQKNLAVYALGAFLVIMITQAIQVPLSFANNFLIYGGMIPKYTRDGMPMVQWQNMPILFLLYTIPYGITQALSVGISMCAIEEADTGTTVLNTMFSKLRLILPLLGVVLIMQVLVIIGFVCCIVPGIYLMGSLILAPIFVMNEELGPIEAIKKSYELMKPYAWMSFLLIFVSGIVSGLGVFACCIGYIFTMPIRPIVLGLTYREFRGPLTTGFQVPTYTVPPSSST